MGSDSIYTFLAENQIELNYPKFNKHLWFSYPDQLKSVIITIISMVKFRRDSFKFHHDLLGQLLNYIIWNFYYDAELKLRKWMMLGDKYATVSKQTLIKRCQDRGIWPDSNSRLTQAYSLASSELGYPIIQKDDVAIVEAINKKLMGAFTRLRFRDRNSCENLSKIRRAQSAIRRGE